MSKNMVDGLTNGNYSYNSFKGIGWVYVLTVVPENSRNYILGIYRNEVDAYKYLMLKSMTWRYNWRLLTPHYRRVLKKFLKSRKWYESYALMNRLAEKNSLTRKNNWLSFSVCPHPVNSNGKSGTARY